LPEQQCGRENIGFFTTQWILLLYSPLSQINDKTEKVQSNVILFWEIIQVREGYYLTNTQIDIVHFVCRAGQS